MDYTIYHKTEEELNEESLASGFGKYSAARPICPTYVMTKTGEKRDVWSLSTLQIYSFVKAAHKAGAQKSFEIIEYLYPDQKIKDYSTLLDCMALVQAEGELMRDFIGSMGGNNLRDTAMEIASYKTKVEGVPTTRDEVIAKYAFYEKQQKNENS